MLSSRISTSLVTTFCMAFLVVCPAFLVRAEGGPVGGDVRVARWKDDRTGAFLLMFDDSWPSHWQVAAPELAKRGMIATFYICPGKGEHEKFATVWEETLWKQGMVYGCDSFPAREVRILV